MNHSPSNPGDESSDALERELQSMTPRGLSSSAYQQIDHAISETQLSSRSPTLKLIMIAVAASVLFLIGWFAVKPKHNLDTNIAEQPLNTGPVETNQNVPDLRFAAAAIHGDALAPTHLCYRQAAKNSYEELDKLLAHHGRSSMGGNTPLKLDMSY